MVWNMPTSSFIFYFILPWVSSLCIIIYGITWALR